MTFFIIGIIIGSVMGLTGSGGALVAIPLFMILLKLPLMEATVWSLLAVILASVLNFIPLWRSAQYRLSLVMFTASLVGSYLTTPLKPNLSENIIAILLAIVSIASLVGVWKGNKTTTADNQNQSLFLQLLSGLGLGALTTLTGLGGGVLLMPILLGIFHLPQASALATSLLTIFLSSGASLALQAKQGFALPEIMQMGSLSLGIISSVGGVMLLGRYIPEEKLKFFRKLIFTLVVLLALTKIF